MSKKHDDLMRLAFGELSGESARAVEARASGDASARAELEAMRALRADLQRLPPPPPDNLSAERLRAAILDRELRERRPSPFGWAWAPIAVAALAAFFFVARPTSPKGDIPIVAPETVAFKDSPGSDFKVPDFSFEVPPTPTPAKKALVGATVEARRAPVRRHRRPATEERTVAPHEYYAVDQRDPESPVVAPETKEPETMAAPTSAVVEGGPYTGGPENVVVVSSKRDLDTGAHAATETEASNVLVGG